MFSKIFIRENQEYTINIPYKKNDKIDRQNSSGAIYDKLTIS